MRKVALKGLWLRRGRALLTTIAVVLGVAMVCGTYILTDTIDKAFDSIFTTANQGTDAVVTAREVVDDAASGTATIPASVLEKVRAVDEVEFAGGTIEASGFGTDQIRLVLDGKTLGNENAPKFGIGADFEIARFNPFELADGRFPEADGEIVAAQGARRRRGAVGRRHDRRVRDRRDA